MARPDKPVPRPYFATECLLQRSRPRLARCYQAPYTWAERGTSPDAGSRDCCTRRSGPSSAEGRNAGLLGCRTTAQRAAGVFAPAPGSRRPALRSVGKSLNARSHGRTTNALRGCGPSARSWTRDGVLRSRPQPCGAGPLGAEVRCYGTRESPILAGRVGPSLRGPQASRSRLGRSGTLGSSRLRQGVNQYPVLETGLARCDQPLRGLSRGAPRRVGPGYGTFHPTFVSRPAPLVRFLSGPESDVGGAPVSLREAGRPRRRVAKQASSHS